ncbi:MAG: hypothetical protein Q9175_007960 [Cornicularia normoerica]
MKRVSASLSTVLLWQVNLFSISPTLASPRISPELAPRQVPVSDTSSANVGSAILGIEKATRTAVAARETTSSILSQSSIAADRDVFLHLPLNNSPLFLPSLSGCTSGYTGTVTFTSEFAHQTGFESIDKDQEFWNDTGAVWVVKFQLMDAKYALTQKNWQAQNVDQLLYEWWYKSKDNECNPLDLGSSTLNNLQPPDTSGNWGALEDAIVKNSLLSYTILNDFIQNTVSPSENGILALTFIGAIVGVLGVFWTLLIPGAVIAEVAAEIAVEETIVVEEEVGAVAQIAAHIPPGLASPKAVPAQGAAIYGSIPGALITGSASAWSKIVANKANYECRYLGDAEGSTTKCEADLHGPQSSKYCADGGVYYLQSLSFSHAGAQVRPNTGGPYGYESLSSVGIEAKWICASSAKLYRQYGFNMDYTDVFAFTSAVSSMIADNLGNGQGLIGQLPGEWSLPVCDGGKNYYGRDYTIRNGNWSTGAEDDSAFTNVIVTHEWVPCACGYQGNETSLFQQAANFWDMSWQKQVAVQKSCQRIMTYNNNQGFLNLNGGPPPSQTVDYSGYHSALEISYQPTSAAPVPQNPPWLV